MNHVIQLTNGVALVVDDYEFAIAKSKFMKLISFSRFLTIKDVRGHLITIRKKDILLFEEVKTSQEEIM